MTDGQQPSVDRRTVLGAIATGTLASTAGCSLLDAEADGPVTQVPDDRAATLAEAFAPTLYFDENERWYPTDPRPFESEVDGETVVDGFDALNGYVERDGAGGPPAPTAVYRVLEFEESPLAVVQYWFYSVFDQFTTNFHWHDWELLQVFVDTETEEPQLHVASSHSSKVPNNEFLDPERQRPRLLSELGSHSSGLSVNEDAEHFDRLPLDGSVADITNSVVEGIDAIAAIPLAYGLPRDEGFALPYAVPELDGAPISEHENLPSLEATDLLPPDLTVRSFEELLSPPALPGRASGDRFDIETAATDETDVTYELVPAADVEHIADFVGPQLSFEFAIPDFAEDAIADHITTTGPPWEDPRYEDPAADITETRHRQALSDRYAAISPPAPVKQVIAGVTNVVTDDDAPEDEGVTTASSPLELFALFESEPEAVPTFNGIAVVQDVPEGAHELTINGAGVAPHAESVTVGEDNVTTAGVEGEIPVVANEDSVKLGVDPTEAESELERLAVEDDFGGRLYDAPLSGPDAVYVHSGGAYTAEVADDDDEIGAFRVNPGETDRVTVADPRTGTAPLAEYVADVAAETRDQVRAVEDDGDGGGDDAGGTPGDGGGQANAVVGLANALDAVAEAAENAAAAAAAGERGQADQRLDAVSDRLEHVATRLEGATDSLPGSLARATERRLEQASRRSEQAKRAEKR